MAAASCHHKAGHPGKNGARAWPYTARVPDAIILGLIWADDLVTAGMIRAEHHQALFVKGGPLTVKQAKVLIEFAGSASSLFL